MSNELIRKTDVLDLLNDLVKDFGDNYGLYSTLFDSVDEMPSLNAVDLSEAVDEGYLSDWYISSVSENDPPVWTDEHIEELFNDFYLIPKEVKE